MAEFVGGSGREKERDGRRDSHDAQNADGEEYEWGNRRFNEGQEWWLNEEEEQRWSVRGETVLELGAGVYRRAEWDSQVS